jgi:RNAse (barnase) inhibitor barstar
MTKLGSMWTYVDAWKCAAAELGVQIEGLTRVEVSPGVVLEAEMLVRGFGAECGTLVFETADKYPACFEALHARGLTASSWEPYPTGKQEDVTGLLRVLGDWGWCGAGPPPPWLLTIDATDWLSPTDFYDAVLPYLRAPPWHGRNLDALRDSLTVREINGLKPPFALRLERSEAYSVEMAAFIDGLAQVFEEAEDAGIPVALHVWP